MPKITFLNEDQTVQAQKGQSIRDVAQEANINLFKASRNPCPGWRCTGRCRIWITSGSPSAVSPAGFWERRIRRIKGALRLACKAKVQGDIEVRSQPGAISDTEANMQWNPDPKAWRWKDRLKETGKPKVKAKPKTAPAPEGKPAVEAAAAPAAEAAPAAKPATEAAPAAKPAAEAAPAAKPAAEVAPAAKPAAEAAAAGVIPEATTDAPSIPLKDEKPDEGW